VHTVSIPAETTRLIDNLAAPLKRVEATVGLGVLRIISLATSVVITDATARNDWTLLCNFLSVKVPSGLGAQRHHSGGRVVVTTGRRIAAQFEG
jgi:hypothetical protein